MDADYLMVSEKLTVIHKTLCNKYILNKNNIKICFFKTSFKYLHFYYVYVRKSIYDFE